MVAGKRVSQLETRKKRKIIIFGIEITIILVMLVVLWKLVASGNDESSGPSRIEQFRLDEVGANDKFTLNGDGGQDGGESTLRKRGYLNIALFGVDATTKNQLYGGSRSDSMMIASVNLDTGEIRLVSVYRDTMLNIIDGSYTKSSAKSTTEETSTLASKIVSKDAPYMKCNSAYFYGGAQRALTMLNVNLDLDITTFVTVGYGGLSEVIDGLGGVWIDVDSDELEHINNYQMNIAEVLKCKYTPVTTTGYQKLNGVQAAAYCRIRYTGGLDFERTGRQREVLKAIEKEAKNIKDWNKLWDIFSKCSNDIYTNVTNDQILELLKNITKYSIVDEDGFPQANMRTMANIDVLRNKQVGSVVLPTSLEDNVVWLHKFLFDDDNYTVSQTVSDISKTIANETAPFLKK